MSNVKPIPEGFHSITPSLTCKGASNAIEFYKKAFGAKELFRMPTPDGKIGHAELQIGDSRIMLNDEFGPPTGESAANPRTYLYLYVDNADAVFNSAVQNGAKVEMPLENQFWGDRFGRVLDPFGHGWGISQHVEDVTPEEMKRRSDAWMAKMAKSAGASTT